MYIDDEYAKHKFSSPSSDSIPAAGPIKVELVWTNVVTRWPCTICGGSTEKVSVLAEGPGGIRVCEQEGTSIMSKIILVSLIGR
jgi:hypothetical protein